MPASVLSPQPSAARATLALAVLLGAAAIGRAESATKIPREYTLREWHEKAGLPSEELAGVVQDAKGYLWVASSSVLTRFDGRTFAPVPVPDTGVPRTLTAAGAKVPAIGGTGGYFIFHDGTARWIAVEPIAGKPVRTLFAAPDGAIWLGCDDGTVTRQQSNDVRVFEPMDDPASRKVLAFAHDATGQVWMMRGNRLFTIAGAVAHEVPLVRPEPELRIASSQRGGIWVFTRSHLLRWQDGSLETITPLPELLGAHFVQATLEDSHGSLWIGTRSQGLFRMNDRSLEPVPTSSENIVALCEDVDGNIWVATDGGGLTRLRAKAHQLYDQSSGLKDPFSYTVAGDATGAIWLANRDGGVARVVDGIVDTVSRRANWRQFSAMSVHPAPDGTIWMTSGIGVFRSSATAPESLERVTALNALRGARATFVASNGDYWLAADPDRVARYRDGVLTIFGTAEGFDGREVRAFAEDATGRIWLGAADGALFRSTGERFERLVLPGAERYGTDNYGALQVIRFEPDGTILIGSTRCGVVIVPEGDLVRTHALFSDHGLPSNNVSQILVDDHEHHWFAARNGVFWIHSRDVGDFAHGRIAHVHAVALGRDDGLPELSCLGLYQPAAWKSADGTLWFTTRRGTLRSDPVLVAPGTATPPPVSIISITCDGQARPLEATLEIESTVRRIQIGLSALNLSAPESVQVRFRLDGFDTEWVVQESDRLATYPRLPPGRYVFSTMASDGSGVWSSQPAQLTIVVTPPWWQSTWAQAGYLLALVATVTAVVRAWSHRRLRLRLERAEHARAVEQERARIARNIHDEVGASLTRISLLTQAALDEDAAHSPTLEKIYAATRTITRSMDEIVWAVNPRHDNTESLVYYLGNFAQSFLGAAGIRCRLESPPRLPEATLTSQIRHHVFLACKEALHNIVKHAGATEAVIRITVEDDVLAIRITDDGRGIIDPDTEAAKDPQTGRSGEGLRNMRQRMAEIHGACTLAREPAGGTTVLFTVPLPDPSAA
ncbi:MAG: hypothetical protein IAE82_06880 [Opitutaceae bacterium]|nr:hypothetical protein [Opitutaceae bacterium]